MADLVIAISQKAQKLLEGTELGKLIARGTKGEGDQVAITLEPDTEQKIRATKDGKHDALADRLIICATKAREATPAEETPALNVR